MKYQYYPKNIWQSFIVIILFFIYSVPFILINEISGSLLINQIATAISMIISSKFVTLTLNYFTDYKISLGFKIKNSRLLVICILIIILSDAFINRPIIAIITKHINQNIISSKDVSFSFLLSGIILGPIAEEVIFRGIILKGLLKNSLMSPHKAIIISLILLAIIHFNYIQIFTALIPGFIFGYYYYKSKSLLGVIILHIVANLSIYFIVP